jgi:hypothetical protein
LDLFVVDCEGPIGFFRVWGKFFSWLYSNRRIPPFLTRRVQRVRVTVLEDLVTPSIAKPKLSVDGDAGGYGPLDVEVVGRAADIYVPPWIAAAIAEAESEQQLQLRNERLA